MKLKCVFGIHNWATDCEKCSICGKIRSNAHAWDGCKCLKCGKLRDEQHSWDGCKCKKCRKIRDEQHSLNNCRCKVCAKEAHVWNGCKCSKCGKLRDEQHNWDGCRCKICEITRDEEHHWSQDCEPKCIHCGKSGAPQHDFSQDCEACSRCGLIEDHHRWRELDKGVFTCAKCDMTVRKDYVDISLESPHKLDTCNIAAVVVLVEKRPSDDEIMALQYKLLSMITSSSGFRIILRENVNIRNHMEQISHFYLAMKEEYNDGTCSLVTGGTCITSGTTVNGIVSFWKRN